MTVSRKHHSSSYENPINMKFVHLALVFLAIVVLALAAPPNRQNKPIHPNPRINSQADETTTFRTYQPKYNPFKSTALRTSISSPKSAIGTKATMPMRSELRFRHASILKKLPTDPTPISVPVEEPVVISTTAATSPWPTEPELPSVFPELESVSVPPSSEDAPSLFAGSISSSSLLPVPLTQSHVTSKPPAVSTTSEPYYSTASSSEFTSNSITNKPVLLQPLTFTSSRPQLENSKSSSNYSVKPFASFETISSSTPKSLFSALPRPNTLDSSSRIPKALASPSSPNRPPSIVTPTSTSSVSQSSPVSTPVRNDKSLTSPPVSSPPQDASVIPVSSTNSEPKPKTSVSATSIVPLALRSSKSVNVQAESNSYTKGVPTNYSFAYKVNDPLTKQDFGHSEKRVGNNTKGRYDVLLPDGRRQVVDYQVLHDRGYVADITYQDS